MRFDKIECVEVILYILYFHEVRTCLIIRKKTMTTEIKVLLGDITKITDVDAIVNATNEKCAVYVSSKGSWMLSSLYDVETLDRNTLAKEVFKSLTDKEYRKNSAKTDMRVTAYLFPRPAISVPLQ